MMPSGDRLTKSPYVTGLAGRCPRCGQGALFAGFLTLSKGCSVCGLDFDFAAPGDGPAVLVTLPAGILIVALALFVELTYEPPMWVHLAIFLPLTLGVCLALLRPMKGVLVALQYRHRAEEGRLDKNTPGA